MTLQAGNLTRHRLTTTRRSAFTLVELLVVLAIIGILTSLIGAASYRARRMARRAEAQVVVNELVQAWTAYWVRYGEWPGAVDGKTDITTEYDGMLEYLLKKDNENNFDGIVLLATELEAGDELLDPWRQAYHMRFNSTTLKKSVTEAFRTTVCFPNRNRYVVEP